MNLILPIYSIFLLIILNFAFFTKKRLKSDETQYSRLHDRIAYMKKEALEKINVGKINNVKVMKNSHKKNK